MIWLRMQHWPNWRFVRNVDTMCRKLPAHMHPLQHCCTFHNNLQIGSISATECVNDILQKHPNTGPEWFSLVWCWWQGPISGTSLDMIFTILIRLSDLVLSRDNTITVLKIMHFLGFFNLCMCAIGVPKMFCLLGHFFFSFKGLSYKVLHDKMSFTIVYLLRDRTSSCKLTSPSPSWSAREKIVWISWSLKPDFLKLLLSSW